MKFANCNFLDNISKCPNFQFVSGIVVSAIGSSVLYMHKFQQKCGEVAGLLDRQFTLSLGYILLKKFCEYIKFPFGFVKFFLYLFSLPWI